MILIDRLLEANMEIILKGVQTAILTTISNLLYASCVIELKKHYLECLSVYVWNI